MRPILVPLLAAVLAHTAISAPQTSAADACPTAGQTLAETAGARIYIDEAGTVHACWDEAGLPVLLHGNPAEVTRPRITGRFAALVTPGGVRVFDLQTGAAAAFAPQDGIAALRLSRYGRIAWVAATGASFEVHRGDLAQRDRLLDSGPRIRATSLAVRRGRLVWRNGSRARTADFDGSRGDRPPIDDPTLLLVPGTSEAHGPGPIAWRFAVEVERGLPIDRHAFARAVERILYDSRGWLGPGSRISLQRVDQPPIDFRVTLARPATTDRLCWPLRTARRVSCENRGRSVLNWARWSTGSPYWHARGPYRNYLVNHEVGHSLGHGHRFCAAAGQVAPVMQQQTGPAAPCIHAQWPKRFERRRSGRP